MFDWIRKSVKNAVLGGINDAIAELAGATGQRCDRLLGLTGEI